MGDIFVKIAEFIKEVKGDLLINYVLPLRKRVTQLEHKVEALYNCEGKTWIGDMI